MKKFAFGELGLKPREFYAMSPVDFSLMSEGYQVKMCKQWEHTRAIVWQLFNANINRKKNPSAPRTIEKFLPLPTDKQPATEKETKRAAKKDQKRIEAALAKLSK